MSPISVMRSHPIEKSLPCRCSFYFYLFPTSASPGLSKLKQQLSLAMVQVVARRFEFREVPLPDPVPVLVYFRRLEEWKAQLNRANKSQASVRTVKVNERRNITVSKNPDDWDDLTLLPLAFHELQPGSNISRLSLSLLHCILPPLLVSPLSLIYVRPFLSLFLRFPSHFSPLLFFPFSFFGSQRASMTAHQRRIGHGEIEFIHSERY